MHYEIAGSGTPIVLLHGIGSNSKSWRRQIAAFSSKFRVIAWDAPGFGKSEDPPAEVTSITFYSEALFELFEHLDLDSAIVLGHSLGGVIAQEFYRSHPSHVRALILADTSQGGAAEAPDVRERKLANRLHMIQTMTPQQLARERAPSLLSKNAPKELIDEAIAIMSEVRPAGYEFAAKALADADTRGVLDDIKVPLLMIWGTEDEITPKWSQWPIHARVETIPNAGHLCYAEQPELFNDVVLNFLVGKVPS